MTNEQGNLDTLKIVNIIFAEHEKLSIENPLLKQKILMLEDLNLLYVKSDSLCKEEVNTYKDVVVSNNKQIKKLKKRLKRFIFGTSVSTIVAFLLGLLI